MLRSQYFHQPKCLCRPPMWVLILACILTIMWQGMFYVNRNDLDSTYKITGASGTSAELKSYIYFYYYENIFPLTNTDLLLNKLPMDYRSKNGAMRLLEEFPESLRMDNNYRIRTGDLGRVLLLLPQAWLTGNPFNVSVRFTLVPFFVISLLMLLASFWMNDCFYIGTLIVMFVGSHPTQVYELYGRDQIFSLPITVTLFILSLFLPLLMNHQVSKQYVLGIALGSGILLGTVRQVRTEAVLSILSALVVLALTPQFRFRYRLALVILLAGTFWITSEGWIRYFQFKFRQAYDLVEEVGGYPVSFGDGYHHFWHPLYTGLGDFGKDRGFRWDDESVEAKILPKMDKTALVYDRIPGDGSIYHKPVWLLPEYDETVKREFLDVVSHNPGWYLGILLQRAWVILFSTSPVKLAIGPFSIPIFYTGFLAFFVSFVLVRNRLWVFLKIILFTLPLALTALVIYSLNGFTYYSIYPHIAMAYVFAAIILYGFNRFYGCKHHINYVSICDETGEFRLSRLQLTRTQIIAASVVLVLLVGWGGTFLYRDVRSNQRRFADLYEVQEWANKTTAPKSVFAGSGSLFSRGLDRQYIDLTPREWGYYSNDDNLVFQSERARAWYGLSREQDHPGSSIFYRLTGQQWLVLNKRADVDYVLVRETRRYWDSYPFKIAYRNENYTVYDLHTPLSSNVQPIDATTGKQCAGNIGLQKGFVLDPGQGLNSIRPNLVLNYIPTTTHNQNWTNLYANVADVNDFFAYQIWSYDLPAAVLNGFDITYIYADETWLLSLPAGARTVLGDPAQFEKLCGVEENGAKRSLYRVRSGVPAGQGPVWLNVIPSDPPDNSAYHLFAEWHDIVPDGARVVLPVIKRVDEQPQYLPVDVVRFSPDSAWSEVQKAGFDYFLISDYFLSEVADSAAVRADLLAHYRLVKVWQVTELYVPISSANVISYYLYQRQTK